IRMARLGDRDRLPSVFGLDHLKAAARQEISQYLPIILMVLGDKYPLFHACSVCCRTPIGKTTRNVDPTPKVDSTEMWPPCISMMRLAIESPNPVPLLVLVAEL